MNNSYCSDAYVSNTTVSLGDIKLGSKGQSCTYELTVENTGSVDAQLSEIAVKTPNDASCSNSTSSMTCDNITYKLTTDKEGNNPLTTESIIYSSNGTLNIYFTISYTGSKIYYKNVVQSNGGFTLVFSQY